AGQLYSQTTNPAVATGDGVAMALRAGADLMDLEFFQFHPTAFHRAGAPRFLITEALRGEGALLRNVEGKTFMQDYHDMADLAPRDVVSRALIREMIKTKSAWVLLDATRIARKKLLDRFPNIYQFLQTYELDLSKDLIPVSPSAHYWMGGVRTGLHGETSMKGLYAAGEVACAGVHGANRLASNSLLEGLVFGARAGEAMARETTETQRHRGKRNSDSLSPCLSASVVTDVASLREQLQTVNWKYLGLVRNEEGIQEALDFVNNLPQIGVSTVEELELRNLIDCSKLMGVFALKRRESRGSHYREDYPSKNSDWNGHHSLFIHGNMEMLRL
ncbi:MAG TPA: FAD-binding protein, partial [Acidobacteriota bacterium]|nr:FAD-binding protein [Acidobacteriota bacterium]